MSTCRIPPVFLRVGLALALACVTLASGASAQGLHISGPDGGPALRTPGFTPSRVSTPASARPVGSSGIPLPPGYQDAATNFGGHVDIDGDKIIIADADEVYIYNIAQGWFESTALLADAGITVSTGQPYSGIHDVAIEGNYAMVAFDGNTKLFSFDGAHWNLNLLTNTNSGRPTNCEIHGGVAYRLLGSDVPGNEGSTLFAFGLTSSEFNFADIPGEVNVELSVGDGPTDPLVAVTTVDPNTGIRTVRAFSSAATQLIPLGIVATGTEANGFGDSLAAADGLYWIGAPLDDTGAADGGKFELYFADGFGGFAYGGEGWSSQAGDQFGRALAVDGDMLVVSEKNADLLYLQPGAGLGVGAVRVVRHDGAGLWTLSDEIAHSVDQEYTTPDNFGASIALDGLTLAAGEPGGTGFVNWYFMPTVSQFEKNLSPPLAGFGGFFNYPGGSNVGMTFQGMPNALKVFNARPLATTLLVLGLSELSAGFKGGVLFPFPDLILSFQVDASGYALLPHFWNTPAGAFTYYAQYWVKDIDGIYGFASTGGFTMRQDF